MNVAIVGTGYVGLVTGVCLALAGHDVTCIDRDANRIEQLDCGRAPFFEPGLDALLAEVIAARRFATTRNLSRAIATADVVMVTVGTPSRNGKIDLEQIGAALDEIGGAIARDDRYRVVVIKSTVVPATTDGFVASRLAQASGKRAGAAYGLAMNPEFLREGSAIDDFKNPDRIVIGEYDARSGDVLVRLYDAYDCPKLRTSLRDAELIKYTSNALLATLISFSNEIATICETVPGLDADNVMDGLELDRRLSPMVGNTRVSPAILSYLRAGAGFGGSCLPKDVSALRTFAAENEIAMPLLDAVLAVNRDRPAGIVRVLRDELGDLRGKLVSVLGLAFKAGTDDIRESAALRLADQLLAVGAGVRAFDPIALGYAHNSIDARIGVASTAEEAFRKSDAVVLMTAWPEFERWPFEALTRVMRTRVIVDGRNALRDITWPQDVRYRAIGTTSSYEVSSVG